MASNTPAGTGQAGTTAAGSRAAGTTAAGSGAAGSGAAGTGAAGTGALGAVAALQAALAAEDAAVFGYGVAGAHLTGSRQRAAEQDWTGHSDARDALAVMITKLGATPVAAQAYYELPFAVRDAATAMELAAYLEDGVARAYLGIVAVSNQQLRGFGARAMQGPAQRAAYWRGHTQAFPGLTAGLSGLRCRFVRLGSSLALTEGANPCITDIIQLGATAENRTNVTLGRLGPAQCGIGPVEGWTWRAS